MASRNTELDSNSTGVTTETQYETFLGKPHKLIVAAHAIRNFWKAALAGGEVPPEGRVQSRQETEAMRWVRDRTIGL